MTNIIPVDEEQLRVEIQKHYAEVAVSPDHEFHTGREAARKVGYSDAIPEDIPDEVIASFDGVAKPFHFGLPRSGDTVLDMGSGAGADAIIARS